MTFTSDETKRRANIAKHGLDFADAEKMFAGPMVLFEDDRSEYGEQRMIGIGLLDYLVVLIVHRSRSGRLQIKPSARRTFFPRQQNRARAWRCLPAA